MQDEQKGKSTGSKVTCACGKASGHAKECTVPGNEHHWMHEGNDEADRLAKQSKDMDAMYGMAELLKGEEAYVLGNRGGVAQGGYREWIIENLTSKYMRESKSIAINMIKEAKGNAQFSTRNRIVAAVHHRRFLHVHPCLGDIARRTRKSGSTALRALFHNTCSQKTH